MGLDYILRRKHLIQCLIPPYYLVVELHCFDFKYLKCETTWLRIAQSFWVVTMTTNFSVAYYEITFVREYQKA